jgi:hypothetical protein
MKKIVVCCLVFFVVCFCANAVIISGGDGTGNTSAPSDDPGWENVGRIAAANGAPSSVTYLGNSWFITAHHVHNLDSPTNAVLDSGSYAIDQSSWTRITNSSGPDADLDLFKVNGAPTESGATIRSANISLNSDVVMIGNGRNRRTGETYWDAAWAETTESLAVYTGYKYATGSTKRWGENSLDGINMSINDGYGTTTCFRTQFDDVADDAQGATYDSGGGVFMKHGTDWEVAGVMITVGTHTGQPGSTAVFGNKTYIADLTTYKDQIDAVIPEPMVAFFFAGAGVLWWIRKRVSGLIVS